MKRYIAVLLLALTGLAGCHLHIHVGGRYTQGTADEKQPPFELVFPDREADDAKENRRDQD